MIEPEEIPEDVEIIAEVEVGDCILLYDTDDNQYVLLKGDFE